MADNNPVKQFIIKPIVELELGGVDISFTNSSLWMFIAAVTSVTLLSMAFRNASMVPTRFQAFGEIFYEFIANMVRESIGSRGREYFPFVFTIFVVVLFGNVLGLIPYSFTYTSHLVVTGALAVLVTLVVLIFGFAKNGMQFMTLFVPSGTPFWLALIVFPLEVISFFIRPLTLSLRLFANMMAGHLVLKVFAGFGIMMMGAGGWVMALTIGPVLLNACLYGLELIVALVHAYIFTILTCIYLKDTVDLAH